MYEARTPSHMSMRRRRRNWQLPKTRAQRRLTRRKPRRRGQVRRGSAWNIMFFQETLPWSYEKGGKIVAEARKIIA